MSAPLPVIVTGVTRNLAFFDEITQQRTQIACTLEGSHDSTLPYELGRLVWPLMQKSMAAQRQQVLERLGEAIGVQRAAFGVVEIWRLAQQGRGATLFVEEKFHAPGRIVENGSHLLPADDALVPGVMDDAVDNITETVLNKAGSVVIVDNGTLKEHERIALILPY